MKSSSTLSGSIPPNPSWQLKMSQHRELRQSAAQCLYDRLVLLHAVYHDPEYVQWCRDTSKDPMEAIECEVDDLTFADVGVTVLFRLLALYPARDQWTGRDLRSMLVAAIEHDQAERDAEKPPRGERENWKVRCILAEKECERLRGELAAVTARTTYLEREIDLLRSVLPAWSASVAQVSHRSHDTPQAPVAA